jgi:hypothetical protein
MSMRRFGNNSIHFPSYSSGITTREMVIMAGMADHERKIVIEFCHLLEKSKQLFNGLR